MWRLWALGLQDPKRGNENADFIDKLYPYYIPTTYFHPLPLRAMLTR